MIRSSPAQFNLIKQTKHKKFSKVFIRNKVSKKKNELLKIIKLKKSVEKNKILELNDIETVLVAKKNTYFLSRCFFIQLTRGINLGMHF